MSSDRNILVIVLLILLIGVPSSWAKIDMSGVSVVESETWTDSGTGIEWTYVAAHDQVTITGVSQIRGTLVIPDEIDGKLVAEIGAGALAGSDVDAVIVPESVYNLGENTFGGCSSLRQIDFEGEPPGWLEDAGISTDVLIRYNDEYAESWCDRLSDCGWKKSRSYHPLLLVSWDYEWRSGGVAIRNGDIWGESKAGEVRIPQTLDGCPVTEVCAGAFSYGRELVTSVTVPESVVKIGGGAFSSLPALRTAVLPSRLAKIEESLFANCSELQSVNIPTGVVTIGDHAFWNCRSLKDIELPIGLRMIGENAFCDCDGLSSVTIPSSVTNVGVGAFSYCQNLSAINVGADNAFYTSFGGVLYDKNIRKLVQCPATVTSLDIPSTVECVAASSFAGCDRIDSIHLPASVSEIGPLAFSGCYSLSDLTVDPLNRYYRVEGGVLYDFGRTTLICCLCGNTKVDIPQTVESIAESAFDNCDGLSEVVLPDGLREIGVCAFSGCWSLKSVRVPSGIRDIPNCAFGFCQSLTRVEFVGLVTNIGSFAFGQCSKLQSCDLPKTVEKIGLEAFYGCGSLKALTLPARVEYIGGRAFSGCRSLELTFEGAPPRCDYLAVSDCCGGKYSQDSDLWEDELDWDGTWNGLDMEYVELYTVTFDLGEHGRRSGGGELSQMVAWGEAAVAPTVEVAPGYTFDGWETEFDSVDDDLVVAARYARTVYSITYVDTKGATNANPSTYTVENGFAFKPLSDVPEYRFVGWSQESVTVGTTGNISVTALWKPVVYPDGFYQEEIGEHVWSFRISGGEAEIVSKKNLTSGDDSWSYESAISPRPSGIVVVPEMLGGRVVTRIGACAFTECAEMTAITIPATVTSVGHCAFWGCEALAEVTWLGDEASVTLGAHVFVGTPYGNAHAFRLLVDVEGVLYSSIGLWPAELAIPEGVTGIAGSFNDTDFAEGYAGAVKAVTIPASVLWIENYAFSDNYALRQIRFKGDAPDVGGGLSVVDEVIYYIERGSSGWGAQIPGSWFGHRIEYAPLKCAVTFELGSHFTRTGGGELTQFVNWCDPAVTPEVKAAKNYVFEGWDADFSCVTSNMTVHALYGTTMPYVSAVVAAGCEAMGSVSGSKNVKTGAKASLKATAKSGYAFAGWLDADGNVVSQESTFAPVAGTRDRTFDAKFIPVADDWVTLEVPAEVTNVTKSVAEPLTFAVAGGSLPTVKVTGTLPTGLKFTAKALEVKATKTVSAAHYEANTIYGTPTKSGVYAVTVTATTAGKKTVSKSLKFIVRAPGETLIDVGWDADLGKVTGLGVCAAGKSLTLKATANKGSVFAGWYQDAAFTEPAEGSVDYRTASFTVADSGKDQKLYARFVPTTADQTVAAVVADSYDLNGPWTKKLDIDSLSLPTVTVKGLPTGLKFDAKTLTVSGTPTKPGTYTVTLSLKNVTVKTAKTQTFVLNVANIESPYLVGVNYAKNAYVYRGGVSVEWNIAACACDGYTISGIAGLPTGLKYNAKTGRIEGVPTKAGPFTATITLKNGNLTSLATVSMTVESIDAWAYGTFNGGSPSNQVQLTVSSAGKLSGKIFEDGLTYSLAATAYSAYDADTAKYLADVIASWSYKEGKKTVKTNDVWTISVAEGVVGGVAETDRFCAWQNVWAQKTWKDFGTSFFGTSGTVRTLAGETYSLGEAESVTLIIKPNGAVTVKGVFDTGTVNRQNKPVYYSASGSAVVCVTEDDPFAGQVFVYFPPNATKGFDGYVWCVQVGE